MQALSAETVHASSAADPGGRAATIILSLLLKLTKYANMVVNCVVQIQGRNRPGDILSGQVESLCQG